ncbi:beta-ketoacyl synthase N-terminal-like domain-containing protein [Streptomyces sp. NPDC096198]|uniref:beta-ketoacyl synthase N-terminal-like domain-containing protein n=1 Tax=Streptomyces sp. NPDC096198 TaxID=3366080 RepID=UPI0038298616
MGVVITGIGLITALGADTETSWAAMKEGRSALRAVDAVDTEGLSTQVGGEAPFREDPDVDRCLGLAVTAAREAVAQAGLEGYAAERVGVVVGSSLGTIRTMERWHRQFLDGGPRAADVRLLTGYALHSVADAVAEATGLTGPRSLLSNACAAGAVAIGYGWELMRSGEVDAVLVGGVDPLAALSFHGFNSLGALDRDPCSPYTRSGGLTLGEGAGFLVLEHARAAARRKAPAIAEVAGYGLSTDAHHQTAPDPGGRGALRAMRAALDAAGVDATEVDYVNGHGTGTPANDSVEPKAIAALFSPIPPVSSTKSMVGHTLGAAGAVEAACCALAIRDSTLPPTITPAGRAATASPKAESGPTADSEAESGPTAHAEAAAARADADASADPAKHSRVGLDIVADTARRGRVDVAVSNSFAFGGNNAALVLRRSAATEGDGREDGTARSEPEPDVVITGIAGIAGAASTHEELTRALRVGTPLYRDTFEVPGYGPRRVGRVDATAITRGINPAALRRMDPTGTLAASAVAELHRRHGKPPRGVADETGLIFATGLIPGTPVEDFHRGVVLHGASGANPKHFPNTVVNAAVGHVAILHRFRGVTATVCSGGTSGIGALHYAYRLIRRGAARRITVVMADDCPDILVAGHVKIPGFLGDDIRPYQGGGTVLSAGAVAVQLDAADHAAELGCEPLGRIAGFGLASDISGVAGLRRDGRAWARSLTQALDSASLSPGDIDMVCAAAMGRPAVDDTEAAALALSGLADRPVNAVKAIVGETQGSAPGFGLVAALDAMGVGRLPGTAGVKRAPGAVPGLVPHGGLDRAVTHALVSGFAYGASHAAMAVSRWER